jgi:hypothetical protein
MLAGGVATEEEHVGGQTEQRAQEEQVDHVLQELKVERDTHTIVGQIGLPLTFTTKMDACSGPAAGVL